MKKRLILLLVILAIFVLLISPIKAAEAQKVLSPCSSGGLTTAVNKQFQMTYTNEAFLQINNIDLLKEVSQLKDLTCLQYLDATDRNITGDIANLQNLKNLEVFSLYSNPEVFGDICSLAGATKLRSLKFAFDPKITGDVSCLKSLTKLETFAMTHTQISGDLSVFANMPNLKAIYIGGTNIRGDICALSKLTNLEELGIADEYPGNPDITGELSCLNNLKKLTKVSLYNTKATNCEQFTKDHPSIEQGGCSRESLKTLVDYGQKYEKKIGKETQTEVRGQPNYRPADVRDSRSQRDADIASKESITKESISEESIIKEPINKKQDQRNFFTKFIDWIKSWFGLTVQTSEISKEAEAEEIDQIRPTAGPEGCRTQAECDLVCSKPENKEICSKFTPPTSAKGREKESLEMDSEILPNLEQGELGGCKTRAECEAYCSNLENKDACSKFTPSESETEAKDERDDERDTVSKPVCRVSVLPSSKGTAPYEARVCVDNPNERLQQKYTDYVDFEGDGGWDEYEDGVHGCHSYTFQKYGTFSPTAKIVNSKGIESEICQTTVTIN